VKRDASKERNKNTKLVLGVLGGLLVVALPGRFAWSMRSSALSKANDVKAATALKNAELAKARSLKAKEPQLENDLFRLGKAMPVEPEQTSLVDQLSAIAREANVKWTVLESGVPDVAKKAAGSSVAAGAGVPDTTVASAPAIAQASGAATAAKRTSGAADAINNADAATVVDAAPASGAIGFTFDSVVIGNEGSITAFLDKVRTLDRLVVIDKLLFGWPESKSSDQSDGGLRLRMTLRAFTWAGGKSTTATTSAVAATGTDAKAASAAATVAAGPTAGLQPTTPSVPAAPAAAPTTAKP